jgi:PAS domain-containing protein
VEAPQILKGNSFLGHLLNTVITTAGVLGVAMLTFKGNVQPAQMEVLAGRVSALEQRLDDKTAEIAELNRELLTVRAENSVMRIQLDKGYATSPRGTLYAYMDALETPAWCKEWSDPSFRMLHINRAYENYYGITKARYVGNSDFDVFPPKLAQAWTQNDKRAYQRRGFVRFVETVVTPNGEEVDLEFWKFYLRLPDAGELICGIQIGSVLNNEHGEIQP